MGSYGNAIMAGFICRLCFQEKKCVIHLYSAKARKMSLLEKMARPIKVDKDDKLPKTVCEKCIKKVDKQYKLIEEIDSYAGPEVYICKTLGQRRFRSSELQRLELVDERRQ